MFRPASVLCLCALAARGDALDGNRLAPLPDARGVAAPLAGVHGGALIVAGGANFPGRMPWKGGAKVWHDRIRVLEKPEGPWRDAGRLPRPLAYGVSVSTPDGVICVGTVPCVEWRGRLILPSGEVRPGVRSPDTWSFVPCHP